MPIWFFYALTAAVALGSADFFVKMAAGKISNSIALVIFGVCTLLVGVVWVSGQRLQGTPQHVEVAGLWWAIAVGLAFTTVTIALYATFTAGAPISLASPFIRVGGLLLASLAGIILLREPFTLRYALGMALAIAGIYLIITR